MKIKESALLIATLAAGNAVAADLQAARTLLHDGKPREAYALLEPDEFEQAGDIDFDTLLGIAALDSGKPDKATLAFERVLAQDPNSAGVRLDMARAYFALGDYVRSRQELNTAASQNPPPAARLMIDKYLAALEEKGRVKRTAIAGYAEAFTGYDDNITSVVGDFTGAVLSTYNLPGFLPTGNSVKRSSSLLGLGGGVDIAHKVDDALSLYAGADARQREVLDAHDYSSSQLDLRAGAGYAFGANSVRAGIIAQVYRQRTDTPTANRNTVGINTEWKRTLGVRDQISLYALALHQRYPDIPVSDINSAGLGSGWLHLFEGKLRPMIYATVLATHDGAINSMTSGADNSKRSVSARVYGQLTLNEQNELFTGAGYLYRRDLSANARSPLIDYGGDHVTDGVIGWNWRPATKWNVRSQVAYTNCKSNIALSEYKRTEATVTVRYDF